MPCNTMSQKQLQFLAQNVDHLKKALELMGLDVKQRGMNLYFEGYIEGAWVEGSWNHRDQQFTYDGRLSIKKIKLAYAGAIIMEQWGKMGQVTQVTPEHYQVSITGDGGASENKMDIKILNDGETVKVETGKFDMQIHASVEAAMKAFLDSIGTGPVIKEQLAHWHEETGFHTHTQEGQHQ